MAGNNITTHDYIPDVYWKKHFEEVKTAISNAEVYIFEDTEIKGFVGLVGHYIAGIFVKQNFQSQGIGGQLISFLQESKNELSLNVYERNTKAIDFYKRYGFKVTQRTMDAETKNFEYHMIWKK